MVKLTKRKGFNFFRSYYDVYNELESDKDKVAFIDALLDRQFLGVKPTDLKGMAKFAYISQTNSIDSQVKGYEDRVIALNKGVSNFNPWQGVEKTILTPPQQEKEKGEVKEKEKGEVEYTKPLAFNFYNSLINLGGEKQLVSDWIKVRTKKKSVNSETALKGFITQVEKTNATLNEILEMCVIKSWAGFNSEWYKKDTKQNSSRPTENIVF